MGTKTIGLREDVYERLRAQKRPDESFTDLVDRLLDEREPDWREGFGTLSEEEADELREAVTESRRSTGAGLAGRQTEALDRFSDPEHDEHTGDAASGEENTR